VRDRHLVEVRIRKTVNVQDKVIGISFRRHEQLKPDMAWGLLGNGFQSNTRDRFEMHFRISVVNGREKTKGRSLDAMGEIKKCIVVLKAVFFCLAHAVIFAMCGVIGDHVYKSYRDGYDLKQPVEVPLRASVVDLINGGGLKEFKHYNFRLKNYCVCWCKPW